MTDKAERHRTRGDMAEPAFSASGSRLFTSWLTGAQASLAFTTYQAGKVFFIGMQPDGRLSIFERTFARSMGLATQDKRLWMATLNQLWRFEDFLEDGQQHNGFDAVYVPLESRTTGDVDVHDIGVQADGQPIFVTTLFNCLAVPGETHSFRPVWKPPFIDRLVAEDRCHLNGLAMEDGKAKYVSMVSTTNISEGWREHRESGGVIMDVESNEIVATGLSMPHSPRVHNGVLWLLNAGTGEFGKVDSNSGKFEPVAFCPGFLRGLTFIGDHAIVGLSKPRENKTFQGLALNARLEKEGVSPQCGLKVIDLKTGAVAHSFTIEGVVEELYDVVALPGLIRPMALGFKTEEIRHYLKPAEVDL
ncbi:TIGR03032 family protein [Parvularcula sp. IMCC14364]|uniref:TIGR03032 family protein n=1 Tax=Parvularcula sp. IMCC14364 TaxID=3067902 RepID=UPI002740C2E3|nr:TIGR03032 family protein [Parvularcula sp. IMCC14364]